MNPTPILKRINEESLFVIRRLLDSFTECEAIATPYKNLVAIFFHDLIGILTSYIYRREELEKSIYLPQLRNEKRNSFPYVDFLGVECGIDVEGKIIEPVPENSFANSKKFQLLPWFTRISKRNRKTVGITSSSLVSRRILTLLLRNGYRISYPFLPGIFIPGYQEQLNCLRDTILGISRELKFGSNGEDLLRLAERHIRTYLLQNEIRLNLDLLITGTQAVKRYRFLASQARSESIPVMCVYHGEAHGVKNEPGSCICENTFSTHVLGYGEAGKSERSRYSWQHSLIRGLYGSVRYLPSNSSLIMELFDKRRRIARLGEKVSPQFVYVPTHISGFNTYGPYRSMPDLPYMLWQTQIAKAFPGVIFKRHPKDEMLLTNNVRVVTRPLQEMLDYGDVYIFDFISTAFCIAAATDKPIVFFDLGINNLTYEALSAIMKRCIYIKVDDICDERVFDKMWDEKDKDLINVFSNRFSLISTRERREETFMKAIHEILCDSSG